uniref:Transposase domain-containing protein n=1 Tax=Rhizophagus irregularis (strain DAOM 181602 / DAOM 197198 / MUCL 43194) TaxID=747089 RepID=U9UFM0_RHIID
MTRKRAIASIINDETQVNHSSGRSTRKRRTRLRCYCSKCNGNFVDPRTKVLHDLKDQNSADSSFNKSTTNFDMNMIQENELELESVISHETVDHQIDRIQQNTQEHETADGSEFIFLPRRSKRHHDDSVNEETEFTTEDDRNTRFSSDESTSGEDFESFEDYSCPGFEPFQDPTATRTTTDDRFLWILIWIMSFRTRFNLPETATELLLKFMKLVLKEVGGADFDEFPDTLYLIKKVLDLKDRFHNFAACLKCHKLYKKQEVRDSSVTNCQHIEYPNSKTRRTRLCQTALSRPTRLLNGQISNQPILIYPFAGIRQQLESMYCHPGFENLLRH